jgi:hypothetical protein
MAAGYQNLYLEQGTTYSTTITLDDVYLNAYNLVGYTASSQIRKSYYSANTTASFSTSINTNLGTITLSLSAPTTANITPGRYVYDAVIKDVNNNVTRILEGIIDVSPSVTR